MADILDINISIKRIVKKQANRANIFTEDKTIQPENYHRITIAIPYIDSFIINLKFQMECVIKIECEMLYEWAMVRLN